MTASGKKIMVVDDDYDFLESIRVMLAYEEYKVIPASGGAEAVAQYTKFKPDIVFLDIKMPGVNGYEVFMLIKKHDRKAKIVFTSSYVLDDEKYKAAKAKSLSGILNKPIVLEDLKGMIRKHAK